MARSGYGFHTLEEITAYGMGVQAMNSQGHEKRRTIPEISRARDKENFDLIQNSSYLNNKKLKSKYILVFIKSQTAE